MKNDKRKNTNNMKKWFYGRCFMELNKTQKMFLLAWVPICMFIFIQVGYMVGNTVEIFIGPSLICIFLTVLILHELGENNKRKRNKNEYSKDWK